MQNDNDKNERDEAEARCAQLEAQLKGTTHAGKCWIEDIAELEAEVAALTKDNGEAIDAVWNLRNSIHALEARCSQLEKDLAFTHEMNKSAEARCERLRELLERAKPRMVSLVVRDWLMEEIDAALAAEQGGEGK
jgi:chromosome segregation ATPase